MGARELRSGYTTGSCAAAAAKASALHLLTGARPGRVELLLPKGQRAAWEPSFEPGDEFPELPGYWKVQKDAGDDPDVTNGCFLYARVLEVTEAELCRLRVEGSGYWLAEYPRFYLDGGQGIGRVTLPGLPCPVGHYAINPVPRRMILGAVDGVCKEAGYEGCLLVRIAAPAGVSLAMNTFNPRVGIVGGISVLGTSGIVRPMSEDALLETIRLDIHMKAAAGRGVAILTPGNYGEAFLEENFQIPSGSAVICSNFIGDSAGLLCREGFGRALYVGHVGKFIKVAAGLCNTHSKYGDMRMETLARMAAQALGDAGGAKPEFMREILGANTTEEAVGMLKGRMSVGGGQSLAEDVLSQAAYAVKGQIERWSGGCLAVEAIVFSSVHHVFGATERAEAFLRLWKGEP